MRWTLKPKPNQEITEKFANELGINRTLSTLLLQRGIESFEEAKAFFSPSLDHLHDPFLMRDMQKATFRIEQAIEKGEKIMVFGDYDVDGTTAVSLLASYLKTEYPDVCAYIPDRYAEGYGISFQGINFASDNEITLIIALDCGIKSVSHVQYAKEQGIDFIICDHHLPGEVLPQAIAVLDPKRTDCDYPYKELCGCGIGFKLIQALAKNKNQPIEEILPYLDLVATAIAADIVPITGENRVLSYLGLEVINTTPRPGITALIHGKKIKKKITISDVVFTIAPRINAAGRIKHGNEAVALLSEFDFEQAQKFALEIEKYNSERKNLDQQITQEALNQIQEQQENNRCTTVVFDKNWHKGVIGIVASRLIETYYRPTIVFTQSGDKYVASARSVKNFDLYDALESCSEYLEQFGGHKYAAGMTLKPENYLAFKEAFEEIVQKNITPEMKTPEISIDLEINFEEITPEMASSLKEFEPFGPGNMTPVFLTKKVFDTGYPKIIGTNEAHLKLFLKQNNSEGLPAIGFGLGEKIEQIKNRNLVDIVYSIEENEWNGNTNIQLAIRDFEKTRINLFDNFVK